jgi:hypothetical protein
MKTSSLFTVIVLISLLSNVIYGQNTCKVLNPRIGDSYTGPCKQGLADGNGVALGIDQYKGEFKKGLPDGQGVYIWQTGEKYDGSWKKGLRDGLGSFSFKSAGRDTLTKGIWKEDRYLGEKEIAPYAILYRNSIIRVSCVKSGDIPNYVVYKFSRAGGSASDINELQLQGSSGDENISTNFIGFEQVTFPFEGKIKFIAPNALHTSTISYELRYAINQPGAWTVTIYY